MGGSNGRVGRKYAWYDPNQTLLFKIRGTVVPFCFKQCLLWAMCTTCACFAWDAVRDIKDEPKPSALGSLLAGSSGEGLPQLEADDILNLEQKRWQRKLLYHLFLDCEQAFTLSTGFLTFILGFFNSTVYSRWWSVRVIAGVVIGRSIDTAVMFSAYLRKGSRVDEVREDLMRLLAVAHKVTYFHTCRVGLQLQELIDEGLIKADSDEAATLQEAARQKVGLYSVAYGWVLARANKALTEGEVELDDRLWGSFTLFVQNNVTAMRGSAADLMMYLDQPIPMGYTHLLEVMVYVYCWVATFGLVPKLLWLAPPVVFLVTFFFYGFYTVGLHMFDPFDEGDCFGFDTQKFFTSVKINCDGVNVMVPPSNRFASGDKTPVEPLDSPNPLADGGGARRRTSTNWYG